MGAAPSKQTDQNLVEYLNEISDEEKTELFDFIANNQEADAIALACRLINKQRKGPRHVIFGVLKVPEKQCREYGVYMYSLFRDAYWHAKAQQDTVSTEPVPQGWVVSGGPVWPPGTWD